jgi:nucleotide-binding universal stress UspA family protein
MQKLFNNILVPVDFSRFSKKAFERAIETANAFKCNIHLLHISNISPLAAVAVAEGHVHVPNAEVHNNKELEFQLEKLKNEYKRLLEDENSVHTYLSKGLWNETIIDFILNHKMDLVLIGQPGRSLRNRKMSLDANRIAEKTNIPVITIPENRRLTGLRSIVIPITDFLPVKKLMYGVYIAQHFNTTIRLLGVEDSRDEQQAKKVQHYLKKSFQLIKDNCSVLVKMTSTSSHNVADAVNNYAFKNSADLIIVNPGKQTRMPGFFSSLFGNFLQKFSAPPVLTVNPV